MYSRFRKPCGKGGACCAIVRAVPQPRRMNSHPFCRKEGTALIAYAVGILRSIDIRLWLCFGAAAAVLWLSLRWRPGIAWRAVVTYGAWILVATLLCRKGTDLRPPEWIPLWSWVEVFRGGNWDLLDQILLNILLFVPLGAALYSWSWVRQRRRPLTAVWLIGLGLSACVEVLQLLFHLGLFEWDDMLHNGLGCLLGGLAMRAVLRLRARQLP